MLPWLLLGTLSPTLWGRSGWIFQPLHASRFQGNPSSTISAISICCRIRCHFCAFLNHFGENVQNCWRSFGSFCASFFFSVSLLYLSLNFVLSLASLLERPSTVRRSEAVTWPGRRRRRRRRGPNTPYGAISVHLLWMGTTWDLLVLCKIARTIVLSVSWLLRVLLTLGRFVDRILIALFQRGLESTLAFGSLFAPIFEPRSGRLSS